MPGQHMRTQIGWNTSDLSTRFAAADEYVGPRTHMRPRRDKESQVLVSRVTGHVELAVRHLSDRALIMQVDCVLGLFVTLPRGVTSH